MSERATNAVADASCCLMAQGDEELARRLPISPLCDREKHGEVAKSQFGFMNFVAIPLFEELVAVDQAGNVE